MSHAIVWIDHREAHLIQLSAEKADEITISPPQHIHRKHPKGESGAKEHPEDAKRFFHDLGQALAGSTHILAVGPGTAKLDFVHYVQAHDPALAARIVGTETVDHPTDAQLAAYARKYFKLGDQP